MSRVLRAGDADVRDYLESLPKGTVIQVTNHVDRSFWLVAEGGTWHDFTLHRGSPGGLVGRTSQRGRYRRFWSPKMLAGWVADGKCTIELAPRNARGGLQ